VNRVNEFDLLSDVAKLLKKHGPEAFERLAQDLSRPDFAERLASILSASAKVARRPAVEAPSRRDGGAVAGNYRAVLVDMKEAQPEKSALLVKLYDDLVAKAALPTMQQLRSFALHSGLTAIRAKNRPRAVAEVLQALCERPLDQVKQIVARVEDVRDADDRSLEGWARIILNKELRTKKAE
jgi:hypothetical protein